MKIDIFSHISTKKYFDELCEKALPGTDLNKMAPWLLNNHALSNIDIRLRLLDRYPDFLQVLTLAAPPLETLFKPVDAVILAKTANDELAELVQKYPDRFIAGIACLPLNDLNATLDEVDRAITQLHLKGVQIFTNINGEPLSTKKFMPLYEKMAHYELPIWIHPWCDQPFQTTGMLGWPLETSQAMVSLASSRIFEDYPNTKFITHHCGGMVPFFEKRIWWGLGSRGREGIIARKHMHKFYSDTAVYGSTAALMCGYAFFGADHLIFGTDMPLGPGTGLTIETIQSIERMQIPNTDKKKIFESNAISLLGLAI